MTATTSKLGADTMDDTIDAVSKALRRAWQLGQTYWQQADSESWTQQAKSAATQKTFEALVDETRALLARQPAATGKEATIRDRARWFVRDFSRDVGFAMSDAQTEVMLNLFLRYAAPLTTEASKPAAPSVKVYPQGVMGIPPYSPPGSGSMTVKPNISRNAAIDKGERPSTGSLAFDYARAEVDRKLGVSSNPAPSVERDERGAKVATKRVDIQALRAHADKGWGDDCLVPKSVIAMIAEELEASRAASTTAVEQDERGAFRDTLRAAQLAPVARAVDAQPVASEGVRHFNYLCSLLPEGFHWSDPLTPDVMNHIVSGASAQSEGLRKDAEQYRWLRDTLHGAKAGGGVEVNNALQFYEKPHPGEEVRIYWYQDTPVGFCEVKASTLGAAIDSAVSRHTGEKS